MGRKEHDMRVVDRKEHGRMVVDMKEHGRRVVDMKEHGRRVVDRKELGRRVVDRKEHDRMVVDRTEHGRMVLDRKEQGMMALDRTVDDRREQDMTVVDMTVRDRMVVDKKERDRMVVDKKEQDMKVVDKKVRDRMVVDTKELDRMVVDKKARDMMVEVDTWVRGNWVGDRMVVSICVYIHIRPSGIPPTDAQCSLRLPIICRRWRAGGCRLPSHLERWLQDRFPAVLDPRGRQPVLHQLQSVLVKPRSHFSTGLSPGNPVDTETREQSLSLLPPTIPPRNRTRTWPPRPHIGAKFARYQLSSSLIRSSPIRLTC